MTIESQRHAAKVSLEAALRALEEDRFFDALQLCGDAAESIGTVAVYRAPSIERASAGKGGPAVTAHEVDAYLREGWKRGPRKPGTYPLTVDDYWFDMVRVVPDLTREEVIEMFAHAAERAGFERRRAA